MLLLLSSFLFLWLQCACLCMYLFIETCLEHSQIFEWRICENCKGPMAVGYFRKSFVWDAWKGSEYIWNSFLLSYLSIIFLLLYLFIHLLIHLLTSLYVSRVYILAVSCYYSHVLVCFIIFVEQICIWSLLDEHFLIC